MSVVATNQTTELLSAIRELAEYRNEDPVATAFNVGNSFYATNEEWRRRDPKTNEEIMQHYRECVPGVAQQVFANYGIPGELELLRMLREIVKPGQTVLDLGAGIGSKLLAVPWLVSTRSDRTHADVGGVLMEFAQWRYARAGITVEMVTLPNDYLENDPFGNRVFDVVICTEVIEHVKDPEPLVALLARHVRTGGLCVATTSFDDGDGMVPMHLNIDTYDDDSFAAEVFPRNGLVRWEGDRRVFMKRSTP